MPKLSIAIVRQHPENTALVHVRRILAPNFSPSDFETEIQTLATRRHYAVAAAALARFVRAERGDSQLIEALVNPRLGIDVRARRVGRQLGLFKRQEFFEFEFGLNELVAATSIAPIATLTLCCLGFVIEPDGTARAYDFGGPFPPTRRERAALALWFLTQHALRGLR